LRHYFNGTVGFSATNAGNGTFSVTADANFTNLFSLTRRSMLLIAFLVRGGDGLFDGHRWSPSLAAAPRVENGQKKQELGSRCRATTGKLN
jgi:hypothetical protein